MKYVEVTRKFMEEDFWSTDTSFSSKHEMISVIKFMKFIIVIFVINIIVVTCVQILTDVAPHWPFIPEDLYPYFVATTCLHICGLLMICYTHCSIFSYQCFHAYCQALLLIEYFKQIASDLSEDSKEYVSERDQSIINERILFGFKQCTKLIR